VHVHVISPDGKAKFWRLNQLAVNEGLGVTG
jgi:hypothetical protein